jgi:hypothetical protein
MAAQNPTQPKFLDLLRMRARRLGLSLRTERIYADWAKRYILANGKRHPRELGAREVETFLTQLAAKQNVAPSSQNQALAALLFLYRSVLGIELPWMSEIKRAKRPKRLPVVLDQTEVLVLLAQFSGSAWVMASLLYGVGLRPGYDKRNARRATGYQRDAILKSRRLPDLSFCCKVASERFHLYPLSESTCTPRRASQKCTKPTHPLSSRRFAAIGRNG